MKAIIMAGGEGSRLRPVLPDAPKPMAPLLGRPIMQRIVELLAHCGVTDIRVTLRYMPDSIINYFGAGKSFGVNLSYSVEDTPLGTAGSVRACKDFYGERDFLVISGDAACDFGLHALRECHLRHGNAVTMALYEYEEPLRYGLVLTDSRGEVRSFVEKPAWERVVTNRVNTGIYMLSPGAMELVPEGEPFDFAKDLFPALLESGQRLMGVALPGYWCDIGTPEAYYRCNLDALHGELKLFGERPELPAVPESAVFETNDVPGRITVNCRDRARLMRRMSETLMEAGADFTDGIFLGSPGGGARVRPSTAERAVYVEGGDERLRVRLSELARRLEDERS